MISIRTLYMALAVGVLQSLAPALTPAQTNLDAINAYSDNILKNVVAPDILNYATLESQSKGNYSFDKDEYGNFIAMSVTPDQVPQNNAVGTEIAINYPFNEGETIRYSWRMRLSRSFVSDAPANRWWLLARWNDQANPKLGERPEDYLVYNPSLMFGYKHVDGKDLISVASGVPDLITADAFGIRQDQWVKFTVDVTWSRSDKGKTVIYVNNDKLPERVISGPNMYSRYHNMFRLGISRSLEIKTNACIYIGDVKVERIAVSGAPSPVR